MANIWNAIAALSSAAAALLVILGAVYAHFQLLEARSGRNAALILELRDRYHAQPMRIIRDRLLSGELGAPDALNPESFSIEDFHLFWELMDQLEFIGILISRGLLDIELVSAVFHRSPPRVWQAVQPYIEARRATVLNECRYLQELAEKY